MPPRIAVIGVGNVLAGDDAAGPTVVRTLEAGFEVPPEVQLLDAGTSGFDVTDGLAGLEAVIFVDAVQARGAPGELRLYDQASLLGGAPMPTPSSLHEPGVREALALARWKGAAPPAVRLVGVIPGRVGLGIGLGPAVRLAIPALVLQVVAELRALGVRVQARVPARTPDLWWERRAGE